MNPRTKRVAVLLLSVPFMLAAWLGVAQQNRGEIQIYVFSQEGAPLEGVEIELENQTVTSNQNGLLNFTYAAGTHTFTLRYQGRDVANVDVAVRAGRVTELILTASPEGAQSAEGSEESPGDAVETEERAAVDEDAPKGSVAGQVTDIDSGDPVASATVVFRGIAVEASTDEQGRFSAEVPEGTYSFSVIHPDYSTQTVDQVDVSADEESTVSVELTPAGVDMGAVTVFAVEEVRVEGGIANLIEETRNSDVVMNLIGQEQIGRTGDSDAAGALKRVTGLTVVDGRFVYVRGMGERYSSSLLNEAPIPSPEVDKRVVPLDLFPTSVVESLAVQKTYSPKRPGEFGGGTVSIRTIGLPEDRYARRLRTEINASVSYNQDSTFTDQLTDPGGSLDFLGIDDGTREMPEGVRNTKDIAGEGSFGGGVGDEKAEELGESFSKPWEPVVRTIPVDYSTSISMRDKLEINDTVSIGLTGSLLLKDSWNARTETRNTYTGSTRPDVIAEVQTAYDADVTTRDIDVGGLFEFVLQDLDSYRIESTSLLVRTTDSLAETVQGLYKAESYDVQQTELLWREQMLFNQAIRGTHKLEFLNLAEADWGYNFSLATSDVPDRTYYIYQENLVDGVFDEDRDFLNGDQWSNRRLYTDLQDLIHNGTVSLSIPVTWFGNASADFIDVGAEGYYQTRESNTRRFGYTYNSAPRELLENEPDSLLVDEYIGSGEGEYFDFTEFTEATDEITASQLLVAGYLATDILLFGNARLSTGARVEWSDQQVQSVSPFDPDNVREYGLNTIDVMPAVNLTVPVGNKNQLRIAGSSTVNRPDLSELSPQSKFSGEPGAGEFRGNPNLNRATLYNADARWETYLAEEEFISFGGFYKYFQNPIETFKLAAGSEQIETLANIPAAQNTGAEIEWNLSGRYVSDLMRRGIVNIQLDSLERTVRWRKSLGAIAGVIRDLTLTGNFAYIWSQIDLGENPESFQFSLIDPTSGEAEVKAVSNTSTERRLQGQSPYVVNTSLGYKNSVSWSQSRELYTTAYLNYNVFGPRIIAIGTEGVPDIYEQPFHQLDFVFRQTLSKYVSIGLSVDNLLNLPALTTVSERVVRATEDNPGTIVQETRKGRSFSISVKLDL